MTLRRLAPRAAGQPIVHRMYFIQFNQHHMDDI